MKKIVDILLIQPPVMKRIDQDNEIITSYFATVNNITSYLGDSPIEPNLGLLSIAANIRANTSKKVLVLDLNLVEHRIRKKFNRQITIEEIRNELRKYDAQIIGLSFMTVTYGIWGIELTKMCYEEFGGTNIFLGGIHPTIKFKEVWDDCHNWIQGIIVGEGEITFCNLIDPSDRDNRFAIQQNPNLYQGNDSKEIVRAKLSSHELYKLPLPAYDLLEPKGEPIVVRIYTTRGCLRHCSFCSVSEFYSKPMSVPISADISKVKEELNKILHNVDISHLVIGDLSFLNDRMSSEELLNNLIKLRKDGDFIMDWWCQSRADLINLESIALLKNAGCKQIAIGCEGGTDKQLKVAGKGESCKQIEKALRLIKKNSIEAQGYWVLGLPGDNYESIKATQRKIIQYINEGLVTIPHVSILVPYPNTPIAIKPNLYGIKILHEDWGKYWMNCDLFGCGEPVYETIDRDKTLLTSDQIYEIWLETLQLIINELK